MKLAIIADAFPPLRTSAAIQLQHLVHEFQRQGHEPWVFVPSEMLWAGGQSRNLGICVVRIQTLNPKAGLKLLS